MLLFFNLERWIALFTIYFLGILFLIRRSNNKYRLIQGWAINLAQGHSEKVAFSGGPNLLREIEASLCSSCLNTKTYFDKLEEFEDFSWMLPPATEKNMAGHI